METVHLHVLPTGKVLFWAYNDDARIWDPATGAITLTPLAWFNIFCSGHSALSDGRLLVTGGDVAGDTGLPHAAIYDPFNNTWTRLPDMNAARWYPTNTTLANGDVVTLSGNIDPWTGINTLPQVWERTQARWRDLLSARLELAYYPYMFLAPNGRVFLAGPSAQSMYLNTSGSGAWSNVANPGAYRDYGGSVLYDNGNVLYLGGGDPPLASAQVIDLNAATPSWRTVAPMSVARRQMSATILADGTVLVTGGTSGPGFANPDTPVFTSEIWNPATETWSPAASASRPRLYHSSVVLLPDGRIFSSGGQGEENFEIYSPPYLFKGARPTITSAPDTIVHGQQFSVTTPDATSITKVHLIKLSSVTHTVNMEQRINRLVFSQVSGGLNVTTPANGNLTPPGYYLLFLVNSNGVPSVGKILRVAPPTSTAPTAPAGLTAAAANTMVTLNWNVAGGASAYRVFRSTTSGSFNFASPLTTTQSLSYIDSAVANGTTYFYVVRATNSVGDSPSSNQASATPIASQLRGTATFIRADTTTLGNWKGKYGADGYYVANEPPSYPGYAEVNVWDAQTFVWQQTSTDPRVLQRPGASDRTATTLYTLSNYVYDIRLTDGQPHWIALYCLDWDSLGRQQTVDVIDTFTGTRLDSRILTDFSGGVYLVWEVTGSVWIRVTKENLVGPNAVAGGLFIGPPGDPVTTSLTAPANGATFTAPASVAMTATAATSSGTISKVEFFQGTTKLGEDLSAPYSFTWSSAPAGSYTLTSRATGSTGGVATSAPVSITVNPAANVAPTVSITAPANGATFTAPATVSITATAGDTDGTVSLVEFFQGTTKIGQDSSSPYSFSWPSVAAGPYSLTAKATDNNGGTTTSSAISITVNPAANVPPTVSITAPANGATFTAPATVSITATAGDTDGIVSLVEFFQGTTKIGQATTAPYTYSWTSVAAGPYNLTARATDNSGGITTSAVVPITVNPAANVPPTVSITAPANGATFTAPASVSITATAGDTDGTVSLVEFFQGTTKIGQATTAPYTYSWTSVAAGPYNLTARATDNSGGITTSAVVGITVNPPANVPPTVSISAPANGATFTAPASVAITASAGDTDGTVSLVEFFQGTTKIGQATSAPYSFTWTNVAAGAYNLTARATDNSGGITTSSVVGITVNPPPNVPPTASITAPANGATFTAPASVAIAANAGDTDGTVTLVEFFQGTTKLGQDTTAPYSFTWSNVAAGSYSLTARATDNVGGITTSAAIGITVNPPANTPPTVSITAPANGASFTAPATVSIAASASDSGGSITLVEFFQGTTKLGQDTTAPYSFSWTNVAVGSYSLMARATDNSGSATTSAAVNITVVPLTAPAAPSQLDGDALSRRRIRLTWQDNASNESGFRIERSSNGTTFTQIDTRGANAESYTDGDLASNTLYYYRVRAYNSAGNSAYSNVISVRTR
jgi:hypothetical protein